MNLAPGAMRKAFVRDASYLIGGSLAQHVLLLILQILLARNVSLQELGRITFYGSTLSLLAIFGTAGITYYLPALARRQAAQGRSPPWGMVAWAVLTSTVFALANLLAHGSGMYRAFQTDLGSLYSWLSATLPLLCLTQAIQAVFIGYGRTRLLFHLNLVTEGAKLLVPLALLGAGALDARNLIIGWFWVQGIALAIHLGLAMAWRRGFPGRTGFGLAWSGENWNALAYLVPASATLLLPKLLVFLTAVVHPEEETAAMGIAMVFMSGFGALLIPYQTALLSHLQVLTVSGGRSAFLRRSARELSALILLLAASAWAVGWFLTVPLFGGNLEAARNHLGVLVLIFTLDAPRALLDPLLVSLRVRRLLVLVESARLGAIAVLFVLVHADVLTLPQALAGTAAACLTGNIIKFLKAAGARLQAPVGTGLDARSLELGE